MVLVLIFFGGVLILAGLVFIFFRQEAGRNRIRIFGQEFELSTPGLVILLAGCALLLTPFLFDFDPPRWSIPIFSNHEEDGVTIETDSKTGSRQTDPCAVESTEIWKIEVIDIYWREEYTERYSQNKYAISPRSSDDSLLIIELKLTNTFDESITLYLSEDYPRNTGIITKEGFSYRPIIFDVRHNVPDDFVDMARATLPGAATPLNLIFSLPKTENIRTLLLSLHEYPSESGRDVKLPLSDC